MEMNQRPVVVIAGASGFIGSYMRRRFNEDGYEVRCIGRNGSYRWGDVASMQQALEGSEWVINLAGKSVQCRPSASNVQALIDSRVDTTRALGEAISRCAQPPSCWINASGAGIYPAEGRAQHEDSPTNGTTIMADVARRWEAAFMEANTPKTRKVILRITLVLGSQGGVFPVFKSLVRLGQGGRQGSGKQRMSWIHVEDLYRMVLFIGQTDAVKGAVNAGAPQTLSNAEFMKSMRQVLKFPFGIPAPEWLLRIGTAIIGVNSELVLSSMDVYPKKMLDHGFTFRYLELMNALDACANDRLSVG